jgi:hypothetical protein
MTNQLSKAAVKSTEELLSHYTKQYAQIGITIETLRELLGHQHQNGHTAPQDAPRKADRIVKRAKARFARHAPRTAKSGRHSPSEWRQAIVDILKRAEGQPVAVADINRQMGLTSNNIFKHLTAAVQAGVISRAPGVKGFYVLGHTARHAPTKKAKKTGGITLTVKAQRQRSLDLLNAFSTETPKPLGALWNSAGKLISHGYLKRTKDGYLRTAKVYEVQPS